LNRWSRLVNASTWSSYWTSDNICGTGHADILFINKFSVKIKSINANRWNNETNWQSSISCDEFVDFSTASSSREIALVLVIRRWPPSCKFITSLCNWSINKSRVHSCFLHIIKKISCCTIPFKYKYLQLALRVFPCLRCLLTLARENADQHGVHNFSPTMSSIVF